MHSQLCACVQTYAVKSFFEHFAHPEVLHQKRIDFCVNRRFNKLNQLFKLAVLQYRVDCNVNLYAVKMSARNDLCDIVAIKILRFHTRVEVVKPKIHRVRAACNRDVKRFHIPCGRKKFQHIFSIARKERACNLYAKSFAQFENNDIILL